MLKRTCLMASIAALMAFSLPAIASPNGVKVGVLNCNVDGGWGYVLGSSKDMTCTYHPNHGEDDRYVGSISKFGVDIGYTSSGSLVWDVVAPTSDVRQGALQGDYGGATASATIAAGLGAHVLFGGFDKSIALQPVSFESNSGLDVAAGIGELSLRVAPAAQMPAPVAYVTPPAQLAAAQPATYVVFFGFKQSNLTPLARQIVGEAAQEARRTRPVRILVTGHADTVGTEAYNYRLSLRRAEVVKKELVRDGLDGTLIYAAGRGYDDPLVATGMGVRERRNRQAVVELRTDAGPRQAAR